MPFDMLDADMLAATTRSTAVHSEPQPLTERILSWLPGPAWAWILAWTAATVVRPFVFREVLQLAGQENLTWEFVRTRLPGHVVLAYIILLSFLAVRRLVRNLRDVEPAIARLTEADEHPGADHLVPGIGSVAGPLVLMGLITLAQVVHIMLQWGGATAIVMIPYLALPDLPIMVLFWTYVMLLIGLDRLGRRKLALDPFPEDCSLGLKPIGGLAFSGFLIFMAATVPFLIVNMRSRFDLAIGLTFLAAGVAVFFLSMARLHTQMVAAKRQYVAWTRRLYAEAFQPMKPAGSLEVLHARAPLLSVAEALEKRAATIQEWPFDERTFTRIVALTTGVVTAVISRAVLRSLGL